jgi:ribose-phosphate pyrophosphokinase
MDHVAYGELKVFGGRAHPALTGEICRTLGNEAGRVTLYSFSDGENYCQIEENVRGGDIFIVQPTCPPANANLMELLIMLDAFKRSSASRVTAVLPYYGYARQDRKDKPRVPITAKLVADLIVAAGADRILSVDLHAPQIQGFFNIPVDHLFAAPVLLDAIRDSNLDPLTVVSPDAGGVERARAFAKRLGSSLAIVDKRRKGKNEVEILHVIGDVKGQNVIVVDDIIDTAGTLINTVQALKNAGAERVFAGCVHAVLSGPAIERINGSPIERIFCTNTIPLEEKLVRCPILVPLSIAPLLAEAIHRIHEGTSVSSLFV